MFSFSEKGSIKPIAEVVGGTLDGKFLYIHRKDYKNRGEKLPKGFFDNIELEDGKFEFFPETREDAVDIIVTTGKQFSGKSTLASQIALKFKKVFDLEDDDVIVVKKSEFKDKAYDQLNPRYIYVNEEFLENPPTPDSLFDGNQKLVIIDDCDTISSAKLKKSFRNFQDTLVQEGRKYHISVIVCAHRMCAYGDTKTLLTESTYFLLFPDGVTSDFTYCLKTYCDFTPEIIKDIKKFPSRWVLFNRQYPSFLLSEERAFIFDIDREEDRLKVKKDEKKRLLKKIPAIKNE